jgi:endoglucanase
MHADGRRIARAVLAHEVTRDSAGRPVLVAGPWALQRPVTVNPSYWMPGVFTDIGRRTNEPRWAAMAEVSVALARTVTNAGKRLPSDWAHLAGDALTPVGSPSGGGGGQYGLDAMRTPAWFAAGCTPGARALAAGWWDSVLSHADQSGAIALTLDGSVAQSTTNPLPLIAAAAAADAAGDRASRSRLVTAATQVARAHSTYYGDAWLVLGTGLLEGSLGACR